MTVLKILGLLVLGGLVCAAILTPILLGGAWAAKKLGFEPASPWVGIVLTGSIGLLLLWLTGAR